MCVIFGQNASSPATKRLYLPGMRWASRSWFIPNPMLFQGAPMECARCLCRRSARGSLTMGLRPKVGLGRGNAKAVPRVPASWAYARAGPRLDSARLQTAEFGCDAVSAAESGPPGSLMHECPDNDRDSVRQ